MKAIICILSILLVQFTYGRDTLNTINSNKVYDFPDCLAEFPGGKRELQLWIISVIKYPSAALENEEQGRVYLSFIVETDGCITNIKVERGVSDLLDQESVRVIKTMPQWIPGEVNNRKVRTRARLPIVYCI